MKMNKDYEAAINKLIKKNLQKEDKEWGKKKRAKYIPQYEIKGTPPPKNLRKGKSKYQTILEKKYLRGSYAEENRARKILTEEIFLDCSKLLIDLINELCIKLFYTHLKKELSALDNKLIKKFPKLKQNSNISRYKEKYLYSLLGEIAEPYFLNNNQNLTKKKIKIDELYSVLEIETINRRSSKTSRALEKRVIRQFKNRLSNEISSRIIIQIKSDNPLSYSRDVDRFFSDVNDKNPLIFNFFGIKAPPTFKQTIHVTHRNHKQFSV